MITQQQIINNAFLMVAIKKMLQDSNTTEEQLTEKYQKKDLCVGIITDIKVSPYYFNKNGKYLTYLFLDRNTGKVQRITHAKTNKSIRLNKPENKILWG